VRSLELMPAAIGDIDRYKRHHRRAMGRILARLEQIAADPSLLAKLLTAGYGGDRWTDVFYIGQWAAQRRLGRHLHYLKVWEIENAEERFRVVYAHNPATDIVHILGIAPREFDYDPDHEFTKRVVADYDKLGCPISN
jgi:hypothetical protein